MTIRPVAARIVFALAGSLLLAAVPDAARAASSETPTKAPDFSLKNLDGKTVTLADFKDKVILLDFWATWCQPCRAEIPHFKEITEKYAARGVVVVAIALDQDGQASLKPFSEQNKINYPVLIGDRDVMAAYGGVRGIPTTFVIDKKGQIVRKLVGYHSREDFEKEIERLLK